MLIRKETQVDLGFNRVKLSYRRDGKLDGIKTAFYHKNIFQFSCSTYVSLFKWRKDCTLLETGEESYQSLNIAD